MEKYIIIAILIIIIFILSIKFRLIVEKKQSNKISLSFYLYIFNLFKINLSKLFTKYQEVDLKILLKKINENPRIIKDLKKLLFDLLKIIKVNEISIIVNYNYFDYSNPYVYWGLWNLMSFIKMFLDKYVKTVQKEKYIVNITKTNNVELLFDIFFSIRLLILIGIKHIKTIIKGVKIYGTSNKRTTKVVSWKHY